VRVVGTSHPTTVAEDGSQGVEPWTLAVGRGSMALANDGSEPRVRIDDRQAWVVVFGISILAFLVRYSLVLDVALDIDVLNLGLSAFHFDVLSHRPQPPGYPGYSLILKAVHLVSPDLGAVGVATLTSNLAALVHVPVVYATILAFGAGNIAALAGALMAATHPIMLYYGVDGQAHEAEALLVSLIAYAAFRFRMSPTRPRIILLAIVWTIAFSVRAQVAVVSLPLVLYALWGAGKREVFTFAVLVVSANALWIAVFVLDSGGLDVVLRMNRALVGEQYLRRYAVLGTWEHPEMVLGNIVRTFTWSAIAAAPLLSGVLRGSSATRSEVVCPRWKTALLATILATTALYTLLFCGEPGYLSPIASMAFLAPATWPESDRTRRRASARALAVSVVGLVGFFTFPSYAVLPATQDTWLPTLSRIDSVGGAMEQIVASSCTEIAEPRRLLLTDNPRPILMRQIAVSCPSVIAVIVGVDRLTNGEARTILVYDGGGLLSLPTNVPLEDGPGGTLRLSGVGEVAVAPFSTEIFRDAVARQATCLPADAIEGGMHVARWPSRCLERMRFGGNWIELGQY